jgi:hypothetical protein
MAYMESNLSGARMEASQQRPGDLCQEIMTPRETQNFIEARRIQAETRRLVAHKHGR